MKISKNERALRKFVKRLEVQDTNLWEADKKYYVKTLLQCELQRERVFPFTNFTQKKASGLLKRISVNGRDGLNGATSQ